MNRTGVRRVGKEVFEGDKIDHTAWAIEREGAGRGAEKGAERGTERVDGVTLLMKASVVSPVGPAMSLVP